MTVVLVKRKRRFELMASEPIVLNEEEWNAFIDLLENPRPPSPEFLKLMQEVKKCQDS